MGRDLDQQTGGSRAVPPSAHKKQQSHAEAEDWLAHRQTSARICPCSAALGGEGAVQLTWDWTEIKISALQWEETLTQQ